MTEADSDLEWCVPTKSVWDGVIRPSSQRFVGGNDFAEAQALARWLARESGRPIDLELHDGEWHFSPESLQTLSRLNRIDADGRADRQDHREATEEHWTINEGYYNERLSEDPSWGRDGTGKAYGASE